jgi:hypothetical protein
VKRVVLTGIILFLTIRYERICSFLAVDCTWSVKYVWSKVVVSRLPIYLMSIFHKEKKKETTKKLIHKAFERIVSLVW